MSCTMITIPMMSKLFLPSILFSNLKMMNSSWKNINKDSMDIGKPFLEAKILSGTSSIN